GNEWARIIPRITTKSAPDPTSPDAVRPASERCSSESKIKSCFMSFGLTQGKEPLQNSELLRDGVFPLIHLPAFDMGSSDRPTCVKYSDRSRLPAFLLAVSKPR